MTYSPVSTLANPPIIEAIIEFRFKPAATSTLEQLSRFSKRYKAVYPKCAEVFEQMVQFNVQPGSDVQTDAATSSRAIGFRLENFKGDRVIVSSIDRLVISIKSPYPEWPTLKDHALEIYNDYCGLLSAQLLTRVGMRFINHLDIEVVEGFDFDHYLRTMPSLPVFEGIPNSLVSFNTEVTIPFEKEKCYATVRQSFGGQDSKKDSNSVVLIFDSDVYCEIDTPMTEEEIDNLLENMRDIKNRLFFGSLTDKAMEAYR